MCSPAQKTRTMRCLRTTKGGHTMIEENIRRLRKNAKMCQEDLAEKLSVVRQTVSKWERGVSQTKGY